MFRRSMQCGFTLVELVITVALVAILAAVALPTYQDFTIRSKVTECLTLSSAAKLAVTEHLGRAGSVAGLDAAAGSFNPTRYCGDISLSATGEIVMTTRNTGASEALVLQLTPELAGGSIRWSCGLVSGSPRHVPAECRQAALASNLPLDPAPGSPSAPTPPSTPPASGDGDSDPAPEAPPATDSPGNGQTPPTTPPGDPAPPAIPPSVPPVTDPPAEPPVEQPPANPPPAGTPPSQPSPPVTPPGGKFNDYPPNSPEWCALHPNPPPKCRK